MNKVNKWLLGVLGLCSMLFIVGSYWLFERQRQLEMMIAHMSSEQDGFIASGAQGSETKVIEKVISASQVWRPVQEKIKDTVVQIFSQVAPIDLLQPYKSPAQGTSSGSGFFINDQGELITNAHVIDQAKAIWIQIPSLGKRIIDVEVVGVSPDRDLALLRVTQEGLDTIRKELGSVPFLSLGDSDLVRRSDEALAAGFPLGQQALKSTTGVISGREQHFIQMSAAVNPGNSGGPLVNTKGEVVGINSAGIMEAQNVGYSIPVNDLKIVLPDLRKIKLLRKPFLGVLFNNATDALTEYLGNPQPGGCYVVEVLKGSTLEKAGVKRGDMIYEINGYSIDIFGEMRIPLSEDKLSIVDYVSRLAIGQEINLVVYRDGGRKEFSVAFDMSELPAIREVFPGFEEIDYEIAGGMVVMELSLNHLPLLGNRAPGLAKYMDSKNQTESTLIVTHIFPSSQLYRSRGLPIGSTLNEVNGMKVGTLDDFRKALRLGNNNNFLTIRASDNVTRKSDNIFVVLPWDKVLEEEVRLSQDYKYPMTSNAKELMQLAKAGKILLDKDTVAAAA